MSQSDFVTPLNGFGHRMAIIQCSPTKKKKRNGRNLRHNSSIISPEDLPKYILRFSSQNDSLYIEAINLSIMYQAVLTSDDLLEHLSNSGFDNCPWKKYFETLSSTFTNPKENITLQKGKGGGYMTLNIKYPIGNQFVLNGSFNLGLLDEYCQNEDNSDLPSNFKENVCCIHTK